MILMTKKNLLVLLWFPAVTLLLIVNLNLLIKIYNNSQVMTRNANVPPLAEGRFQVASFAGTGQILGANITPGDARPLLLHDFLLRFDSPMANYADLIVQEADNNGIDYRMVVAIAMCESNLGKRMPSKKSHNAWGIAVYTNEPSGAVFNDWNYAIKWVSKYIRTNYKERGLTGLKEIGAVWAPPSVEKGYSWSNCVETFMQTIQ